MDTTRAENLSCYGVYKNATPQIDALAKEGVLFQNSYSPIPLTLPSHSTMLTGMYPPRHGIHDNLKYKLNDKNITLAEILKDNGFSTAAVISAFILDSRFGLDQGFDLYDDKFDEELENANIAQRRGDETTDHAISWMQDNKEKPFFLFMHYYDPHMPYDPPEPFKSMILHPYFAEIAYTDHCIGRVIEELKALDLYDSTLIVITGDHGEMLDEHKEKTHGFFIYQGNIKVPLIFKLPGKHKGKIVNDIAGIVDITPTVCSLLGIDIPKNVQGKDLSAYLGNDAASKPKDRHLYSESMTPTKYAGNSLLGIVTDRYKYIQTTRPELYDLVNDPKEAENLIAALPQQGRILQDKLKQILEESVLENTQSELELDAQALAKLETLGYVGGGIEEEFSFDQEKTDPKDLIGYHTDMSRIQGLIQAEQFDTAEKVCKDLISQNITETYGQLCHFMVSIAKKKNDLQMAKTYLQEIIKLDPDQPSAYIDFGGILLKLGESSQAAGQFKKAEELKPDNAVIAGNIAKAYYDGGKLNKAIEYCYKALELKPDYLLVRVSLADTLMKNKQLKLAVEQYYEVLRLDSDNIEALNTLAWIKATSKDKDLFNPEEALRLALHACQIDDYKDPGLLDTLAAAYASDLKFAEAVKMAGKAIEIAREQGLDERAERMTVRLRQYQAAQRK
jgi:arylsulfatase A-like enzyme/Tfp pilus assembly protein PilF